MIPRRLPSLACAILAIFGCVAVAEQPPTRLSALRLTQPVERAVFQRAGRDLGEVPVSGSLGVEKSDTLEVRVVNRQTQQTLTDWAVVATNSPDGSFNTQLSLPVGWYRIEVRSKSAGTVVATATVERVGVGDVFVTCGQSNSANHGQPPQKAGEDRVSTCDFQTGKWAHADDPQPGATGAGGSPWPVLGDLLVRKTGAPVGFICVGVGGTPVSFWTPKGNGYPRLKRALQLAGPHGVRAVLWHQGESDSIAGTTMEDYARMLEQCIAQSRTDAGWMVPWGVALASFHPDPKATPTRQDAIVAGQKKVIASVSAAFQGPSTDSFHTRGWLCDTVHFNAEGLAAHAQGWAGALAPLLDAGSTFPDNKPTAKP